MAPVVDLYRENRLSLDTSRETGTKVAFVLFVIVVLVLFTRRRRKHQKR